MVAFCYFLISIMKASFIAPHNSLRSYAGQAAMFPSYS